MEKNSNQIIVINSLRGIAALVVCLYHFVVLPINFIDSQTTLDVFEYGQKGVQLFFIISGIVIPLSMIKSSYKINSLGRYLARRFVRIEPPYLVAVAMGIVYLYVRNYIPSSADVDLTPTLQDILLHIGYLIPFVEGADWINPVFWTLSVEFQYYFFLAFLFPLAMSNKQTLRWIFNVSIIVFPFLLAHGRLFPHWCAYFGMGIFYALYITKKYSLQEFIVMLLACSVVVYLKQGPIDLAIAFVALLIIHYFPQIKSKIGLFLGKISYSLYLIHFTVGVGFVNFMAHRVSTPSGKIFVVIGGTLISIAFAAVFWRLIEKPSQVRAQKIKLKNDQKNEN